MNRYANGKIYMIESLSAGLVYYGSSCDKLSRRLSKHIYTFKHSEQKNAASEIFIHPDYKIILVENYPCNTKEELLARESYYIRNNPCVNKHIPNRDQKAWYQDNKERILEDRKKKYNEKKSLQNIAPIVE